MMNYKLTILVAFWFLLSAKVSFAQPSMDHFKSSIKISWKVNPDDNNDKIFRYFQDSLELGLFGFYESRNFSEKFVLQFLYDTYECEPISTDLIENKKNPCFCDPLKSFQKAKEHGYFAGLYSEVIEEGNYLTFEFESFSASRIFSDSTYKFISILAIRNKAQRNAKLFVIKDRNGPLQHHVTLKLEDYSYNRLGVVYFFDLDDKASKFYPHKIKDTSEPLYGKITYKEIYTLSGHETSLKEIEKLMHRTLGKKAKKRF